jgi:hypothetical protein
LHAVRIIVIRYQNDNNFQCGSQGWYVSVIDKHQPQIFISLAGERALVFIDQDADIKN